MTRRWTIVMIVAVLVAAMAAPAASARTAHEWPFRSWQWGEVTWEFPGDHPAGCEIVTTVTKTRGFASLMGPIRGAWSHCPEEGGTGYMTLTGFAGVKLFGEYDYADVEDDLELDVTITGGTKWLRNASGTVHVVVELTPVFVPGCDPEVEECDVDFTVPWGYKATMSGSITR